MRRLGHWLAILAIVLQAAWPLVAAAAPRAVTLVPVCTVDGITHYQEVPTGKSPLEGSAGTHHQHCAFCTLGSPGVLPTHAQLVLTADAFAERIAQFADQAPACAVAHIQGARAPPFSAVVIADHDNCGEKSETDLFAGRAARAPCS